MPRLFIAAWPPDAVSARLRRLREVADRGPAEVRWVPEANWHVTLRFVGDAETPAVVSAFEHLALPRAEARLGPRTERLDARQIVVPVAGVDHLAEAVHEATQHLGRREDRAFRGHLTVARTQPGAGDELVGIEIDAIFAVDEIALVTSELRPDGAVYRTVATFPAG